MNAGTRARVLAIAQAMVLAIFFYCAETAKDMYFEISSIEFHVPEDLSLSFIKWHTYAREAVWALIVLWLTAVVLAVSQHFRARQSLSESTGPTGPVLLALGLPIAGALGAFSFDLYLPGL